MNLGDLIQDIAQRFDAARLSYGHGTDNPWDEAVYLALTVTGFADTVPIATNDTANGRAQTRRIEIMIKGGAG